MTMKKIIGRSQNQTLSGVLKNIPLNTLEDIQRIQRSLHKRDAL